MSLYEYPLFPLACGHHWYWSDELQQFLSTIWTHESLQTARETQVALHLTSEWAVGLWGECHCQDRLQQAEGQGGWSRYARVVCGVVCTCVRVYLVLACFWREGCLSEERAAFLKRGLPFWREGEERAVSLKRGWREDCLSEERACYVPAVTSTVVLRVRNY